MSLTITNFTQFMQVAPMAVKCLLFNNLQPEHLAKLAQVAKIFSATMNQNEVWQSQINNHYSAYDAISISLISNPKETFIELYYNIKISIPKRIQRADAGDAYSQYVAGSHFYYSQDTLENAAQAHRYLELADHRGFTLANYFLGLIHLNNKNGIEAYPCFCAGARKGDLNSIYQLAKCYDEGIGTRPDRKEAQKYYAQAAARNHGSAQVRLQYFLGLDHLAKHEYEQAFACFKSGAFDGGDRDCEYEAGKCCEKGIGTKVDIARAQLYYKGAVKQGHRNAKSRLEALEINQPALKKRKYLND